MKHRVSYGACHCGGPQAIARFEENLTSDDSTPHSVRKHIKPLAKPCLSMGSTAVPGGSAISSRGQISVLAVAIKEFLPLTKAANGPNSAISLTTQTFDRILFYVCNSRCFEVQKQNTGIEKCLWYSIEIMIHGGLRGSCSVPEACGI